MKRKKLYSMLALGMAMTLAAGVPVSAAEVGGATSVDTGSFDNDVVGPTETVTDNEVNQSVDVGKDASGDIVKVEITSSANASSVIEEKLTDKVGNAVKGDAKVDDVKPSTEGLTETQVNDLKTESKKQFQAIDVTKIMVNLANKPVSIKPVAAAVQNVAKQAADKMAEKLGLKVVENGLLASADIHIPLDANESAKVTIPLNGEDKPDPGRFDYFVLHYLASTGEWETLPAEVTADGIIVATFDSFSPVFVVKAEKAQVQEPADNNQDSSDDSSNGSNDGGSSDNGSNGSSSSDNAKAAPAPAAAAAPANPAVSPKTGE